ncbi:MAG: T9SS type A sorting domain-containing protein [Chitinophagaceae bacterium]
MLSILFLANNVWSQAQKISGEAPLKKTILLHDESRIDYFPSLIYLDQQPVPSAAYGLKKELLNTKRAEFEKNRTNQFEKKYRGEASNPFQVKGFQGNVANSVPSDNDVAISNDGIIVSVVNSNMYIYNDTGKLLNNTSLTAFVSSLGSFTWISDPRVLYDPQEDRFVFVCFSGSLSTESTIIVGFSQSKDPSSAWNFYTLNGNSFNDSTWSDYPIIALTDKDLILTMNQVKDNVSWTIGFKQSVIWQMDKSTGYDGTTLKYNLWSDIKHGDIYNRNICPAKYQELPFGNNMYFLTLRNVDIENDSIFVMELTDSYESGMAELKQSILTSPIKYGFPPNARQRKIGQNNNFLMTNDGRVLAAIYENNQLHFGANSVNTEFMNAAVYIGTIENINSSSPQVKANIFSTATREYGYPSMTYVGKNKIDHKVLYTFSHCITDSFPGTSMLYQNEKRQFSDIIPIVEGQTYINKLASTTERWGDYTNIQRVYNNPHKAVLTGSYGKSYSMATWLAMVENLDSIATPLPVAQNTIYPNPVTQKRFTVAFVVNKDEQVSFLLFDVSGRKIGNLLNQNVKKGEHEFSFSTESLPRGVYYFVLRGKDQMIMKKKILIE